MLKNIFLTEADKKRIANKVRKGMRVISCPNCGRKVFGKWITEVIADAKCGYRKLPTQIKE